MIPSAILVKETGNKKSRFRPMTAAELEPHRVRNQSGEILFDANYINFKFYLKKPNQRNREQSIVLSCSYKYIDEQGINRPLRYVTGQVLTPFYKWNGKEVIAQSNAQQHRCNVINGTLSTLKERCSQIIEGYYYNYKTVPTPQYIKEKLDGYNTNKKTALKRNDIIIETETEAIFFSDFIKDAIKLEKAKQDKIKPKSLRQYTSFANKVKDFENYKEIKDGKAIYTSGISEKIVDDFFVWLKKENHYEDSTINSKFKKSWKKYLRIASKENITKFRWDDIQKFDILKKNKLPQKSVIFLSVKELDQIAEADISILDDKAQIVRDIFICSAFAGGERYSDLYKFRVKKNPQTNRHFIEYTSQKTGTYAKMPTFQRVVKIYSKYKGKLPKIPDNSTFNDLLQQVCRIANIKDIVTFRHKEVQKWQAITSHTARRSFCTNMFFHYKQNPALVAHFSGHGKNLKQFFEYIGYDMEQHFNEFDKTLQDINE